MLRRASPQRGSRRHLDAVAADQQPDAGEQRALIRQYETRALSEMAHIGVTLWWYKINLHRNCVKGWQIAPSHYLNQHLEQVWLDQ